MGNRLSATDRKQIPTRFAWDRENRLLSTTRAGIKLESNQYDGNSNRIFTTDARGHTTGFEYDERNLLKSENRPLAAITRFVLDDIGDRIRCAEPEGRVMEWSCDLRLRLLREKRLMDPGIFSDGEEQASCYDGNGNRINLPFQRSSGARRACRAGSSESATIVWVRVGGPEMTQSKRTAKEEMLRLLEKQPDDSSYDELLRELAFARMIERGLADSDAGRTISHEEMGQRISAWEK
ncbi:MAG: hypothetical protein AMXMBFR36_29690 [Acidobacteriota bacterium]